MRGSKALCSSTCAIFSHISHTSLPALVYFLPALISSARSSFPNLPGVPGFVGSIRNVKGPICFLTPIPCTLSSVHLVEAVPTRPASLNKTCNAHVCNTEISRWTSEVSLTGLIFSVANICNLCPISSSSVKQTGINH